jgi:hypothetical protein
LTNGVLLRVSVSPSFVNSSNWQTTIDSSNSSHRSCVFDGDHMVNFLEIYGDSDVHVDTSIADFTNATTLEPFTPYRDFGCSASELRTSFLIDSSTGIYTLDRMFSVNGLSENAVYDELPGTVA